METLVLLMGLSPTAAPKDPPFARRVPDVPGISYVAEVRPGLYRGGQPDADGIQQLKAMGVKTIVNLRHFHGDTEKKQVEAAGLRYIRLPLASSKAPAANEVAQFLTLVNDPKLRPMFVHCQHGVDRTGAMLAVYRMEVEGWTNDRAYDEMLHFGSHWLCQELRRFVKSYRPRKTATDVGRISNPARRIANPPY
jgi:tyrosine-protein phosphatase SIW14